MNPILFSQSADDSIGLEKFAIGQPVSRAEDPVLLRGEGRYSDDVDLPGQFHAAMVRSREAHGRIRALRTDAAKAMKGVLAVYTQADLDTAGFGEIAVKIPAQNRDGSPMKAPTRPPLARDKVRFAGEIVACVVARTLDQALDAAEAVELEIDAEPAVMTASAADRPDAPQLFASNPGNVILDYHYGDAQAVAAAFARAHHVTRLPLLNPRVVTNAMEPRSALVSWEARERRWTLRAACQGVKGLAANIRTDLLRGGPEDVRILTGQIGGSFGLKGAVFPEYACLMHAARTLKRPVKWTDRRSDSFLGDYHGRDDERLAELALDRRGRILALRITGHGNLGAYVTAVGTIASTWNVPKNSNGCYATPLIEVHSRAMVTNTVPIGPYRGAGRPEGNYFMERLMDVAAAEMGIDRIALRRRNHIRPDQLPFKAASGMTYDSGDFPGILDRALEASDWAGFRKRRAESRKRGLLRGIGLGQFLEATAGPGKDMAGLHFEADGSVTLLSGTMDFGMGHWTSFAQVLSTRLGVPIHLIRLVQGDSDRLIAGGGSGGSKSMLVAGEAVVQASARVIEKGRIVASHLFETGVGDIEFAKGVFRVAGTDRAIGILELAAKLRGGLIALPQDAPKTLDTDHVIDGVPSTFPNGCHVAEVEIDPETGATRVVRYTAVNDVGTVVNPFLLEGQVHGGVVQGIGQALMERTVFDEQGQLLTGSFMDYCMPRADDLPFFASESRPQPAKTNTLGIKGVGESGCAGALTSVMNAVVDALSVYGIRHIDMPATPERVFAAIRAARSGA